MAQKTYINVALLVQNNRHMAEINTALPVQSNDHSTWTKNDKIKTCKCEPCGNRVDAWSYMCGGCRRHVCSHCLDSASLRDYIQKAKAKWYININCFCNYRSNMDPEFLRIHGNPAPPKRFDEDHKAKVSKGLALANQVPKSSAESRKAPKPRDGSPNSIERDSSNIEDHETDNVEPTLTSMKPLRRGLKRKVNYNEDDSDEEISGLQPELERPSKRLRNRAERKATESDQTEATGSPTPLDRATTVVVGAGVIGLFIARELAVQAKNAGIEHHIVVIELRESYCGLASGHCAGCLSTNGMPEDWSSIANDSKKWWLDIIASADIRSQIEFDGSTHYQVMEARAETGDDMPAWLRGDARLTLVDDPHSIGRINATRLGSWLYEQCTAMNVEFYFRHQVIDVDLTAGSNVSGLQILNVVDETSKVPIQCSNVVIAAGAFTTAIVNELGKSSSSLLENHLQSSDWFRIRPSQFDLEDSAAFLIPDAAASEERLDNEICIIADAKANSITISAKAAHIRNKALNTILALVPSKGKISELQKVAASFVNDKFLDVHASVKACDRGRSELSVANNKCPIIDGVYNPGTEIVDKDNDGGQLPRGVWLCYGFGNYGTLLAPGAAKLLASRMGYSGEEVTSSEDAFPLPKLQRSEAYDMVEVKVKGKGKGRLE